MMTKAPNGTFFDGNIFIDGNTNTPTSTTTTTPENTNKPIDNWINMMNQYC